MLYVGNHQHRDHERLHTRLNVCQYPSTVFRNCTTPPRPHKPEFHSCATDHKHTISQQGVLAAVKQPCPHALSLHQKLYHPALYAGRPLPVPISHQSTSVRRNSRTCMRIYPVLRAFVLQGTYMYAPCPHLTRRKRRRLTGKPVHVLGSFEHGVISIDPFSHAGIDGGRLQRPQSWECSGRAANAGTEEGICGPEIERRDLVMWRASFYMLRLGM